MLVSVIVLLTLMFFIGSAMALAVSSSLHTIAQSSSMDSTAYAGESAVAQGLAGDRRALAPSIGNVNAGGPTTTQWSYAYEVVATTGGGTLAGRSPEQSDPVGPNILDATNYEIITIPHIPSAARFEVYRTAAGGSPSTTGYIGRVTQDPSGNPTVFNDTGRAVTVVDANCASHSLSAPALSRPVNNFALTTSSCRVPVATGPASVKMWSGPAQFVPGRQCASQPLTVPDPSAPGKFTGFKPGAVPGTVWGVIGWHSVSAKNPANWEVTVTAGSCDPRDPDPCPTPPVIAPGLLYFYCHLNPGDEATALYAVNVGGAANVSAFVVRAAATGTDCVVTGMGQAGPVADEADWRLPGCLWTNAKQALWNRVLP